MYSGKENVLQGFTEHFRQLATNNQNNESEYHRKIEQEIQLINQLVKNKAIPVATISELENSIKSINTGKSADIYNLTIEHIINGGEQMITILLQIVNAIFDHGSVPDILKVGLLTPVFKNKWNIAEVINYRGITVLPVINKIIETIIKNWTSHKILAIQNPIQRGFTEGSSPLNYGLPVEETYKENADNKNDCPLVLLDVIRHLTLLYIVI
jgi:hypothetical protein